MKTQKHNPQPLILKKGYFSEQNYDGHIDMKSSAKNWDHYCTYQLRPNGLTGQHQILQLESMQLSYAQRSGGMMNDVSSAKDTLTFAVIEESKDKACFHRTKLKSGDILFFDDSRPFSFMSNDAIKFCVVNIQKGKKCILEPKISQLLNHTISDTKCNMSRTLRSIWQDFTDHSQNAKGLQAYKNAENKIRKILVKLIEEQTPLSPALTRGEEIALDIRDQVYSHMDGKISIESLARQHQISEKTLQNSFKSLFGFRPKHFLRLLKLNHVNNELINLDPKICTVSEIAFKWGFTHMGSFSRYYTDLFGENPSQTLKKISPKYKMLDAHCASRQEEIT